LPNVGTRTTPSHWGRTTTGPRRRRYPTAPEAGGGRTRAVPPLDQRDQGRNSGVDPGRPRSRPHPTPASPRALRFVEEVAGGKGAHKGGRPRFTRPMMGLCFCFHGVISHHRRGRGNGGREGSGGDLQGDASNVRRVGAQAALFLRGGRLRRPCPARRQRLRGDGGPRKNRPPPASLLRATSLGVVLLARASSVVGERLGRSSTSRESRWGPIVLTDRLARKKKTRDRFPGKNFGSGEEVGGDGGDNLPGEPHAAPARGGGRSRGDSWNDVGPRPPASAFQIRRAKPRAWVVQ